MDYFTLQTVISKAELIHKERISTRRNPNNLNSEIGQIEKRIQNEERQ